jgi:hypothetical protein
MSAPLISFPWAAPAALVEHLFREYPVLAEKSDQGRIFRLLARHCLYSHFDEEGLGRPRLLVARNLFAEWLDYHPNSVNAGEWLRLFDEQI